MKFCEQMLIVDESKNTRAIARVFDVLKPLKLIYPNFIDWYWLVFVPGILKSESIAYTITIDNEIAGVLLLKISKSKQKICTLWINPLFRHCGLARELMDFVFTNFPLGSWGLSVNQQNLPSFYNILCDYGFFLESICSGEYYFTCRHFMSKLNTSAKTS